MIKKLCIGYTKWCAKQLKKINGNTYMFTENDQGIVKEFSHQIEPNLSNSLVEG